MYKEAHQNATDVMDGSALAEVNKIQTFVFFDLETTGRAGMETKITELCMVAVSRQDLLDMRNNPTLEKNKNAKESNNGQKFSPVPMLPRVLHKYTRLYYPRKLIYDDIEMFTGLSNELLHRLPGFSSASAEAISLFLDLPKPVAIVAHNGNRYDFPLIKAELNHVGNLSNSRIFQDLQCVDTLLAIRNIDACIKEECELKEILEITSLAATFSFDDMDDDEWLDDMEPIRKKSRSKEQGEGECSKRAKTPPSSGDEEHVNGLEVSIQLPITPLKDQIPQAGFSMPLTPVKAKAHPKPPLTPDTCNTSAPKVIGMSGVRRNLMYEPKKRKWDGTQPFKQTNIYQRLFGSQYNAHRAEGDCIALLEICGYYSDKFVEWADHNAGKFSSVKPMWEKRKSFQIK